MKFSSPQEHQRAEVLQRQQRLKMARSAQAYVRGSTIKFYEWLRTSSGRVPKGPPIWICGDCHLGNLGPVSDSKGDVEIEIRDLDQTVIGNPAHDLIRLALSLSMATRSSDLPGVTTALMLEQMMIGYSDALKPGRGKPQLSKKTGKPVRMILKQALSRKWRQLARERIEDVRPTIPLGRKFWALSKKERDEIGRLFESKQARALVSCLRSETKKHRVEVLDAAYWMKGCSSLGRLRYAVLLGVGKTFCLIDIKEAIEAAAPGKKSKGPQDYAERLVSGARALSPYLGNRMVAAKFGGRSVVIRELRPQDLKFEFDAITQEEAVEAAKFMAGVVGRAHARQMDTASRRKWLAKLRKTGGKSLDAPSWLWTSVVELVGAHEAAYLEHCRRYALSLEPNSRRSMVSHPLKVRET
jgi:uncharacterized protein (DUF2252 family)